MALLKTAWANLQDGLGNRFSWSHVKAIFYNYAEQKLLSTKLDEMDALIDEKIAKAMMSNVQVNDQTKVPTSALAYSMNQEISQNAQDITQLNSNLNNGKLMRAYSTAFVFGKTIPGNSTDNQFDLNIASLGLSEKPSYLSLIPSTAKISNIRYDYDNSSSSIAKIIFDNNGGEINADSYVRFSIIVFA